MIKFVEKDYDEDEFYQWELNGEKRPDSMGDGLWSDGKIVQINPCYMDMEQWSELKNTLTSASLRAILGRLRQMGYERIPDILNIPREIEED